MIGRLRGRVWECEPGRVLLDVHGTGYELQVSLNTSYGLSPGAEADLLVITHVREDSITLFGFDTEEEKRMFQNLTAISGVGPRLALATLSGIGVRELRLAVLEDDQRRIRKIPGIGKKTAARMVLELRDRLEKEPADGGAVPGDGGGPPAGAGRNRSVREDAVSALRNLGYGEGLASSTVEEILERWRNESRTPALEPLLRESLRGLTR